MQLRIVTHQGLKLYAERIAAERRSQLGYGLFDAGPKSEISVPIVPPFHSVRESAKPLEQRAHHNNSGCSLTRNIPRHERQSGTGGSKLCDECARLNRSDQR